MISALLMSLQAQKLFNILLLEHLPIFVREAIEHFFFFMENVDMILKAKHS